MIFVRHASRLGLVIGIVRHEPTRIDDCKARVLHVERVQDQFGDRLRKWLQRRLFDHCTEHIYRHGVAPSGARLVDEWRGGNPLDDLIKVGVGAIKPARNPQPVIRAVCWFHEYIGEAGRVSKKMMDGDFRNAAVGQPRLELRQPAAHGISQAHAAVFGQPERRRRDDRLGHRREQEDVVLLHRTAGLPVSETSRSTVDDVASLGDQNDRAHDAPVFERVLYRQVKPSSQPDIADIDNVRKCLVGPSHGHRFVHPVFIGEGFLVIRFHLGCKQYSREKEPWMSTSRP